MQIKLTIIEFSLKITFDIWEYIEIKIILMVHNHLKKEQNGNSSLVGNRIHNNLLLICCDLGMW